MFRKPTDDRATPLEAFNTIRRFLQEKGITSENCNGFDTHGFQPISVWNRGFQAWVRKKAPRVIWTHALASINNECGPTECTSNCYELTVSKTFHWEEDTEICDHMDAAHRAILQ